MSKIKFMRKVSRKGSAQVFEFSDIERRRTYQQELINMSIYEPKRYSKGGKNHLAYHRIHKEITDVEIWLKSITTDFILNNLREFQA